MFDMERIILDTDLETDCDDVGALCVLHALDFRKETKILGVIASIHSPWPAAAVRAVNLAFGRPDIPVGSNITLPNTRQYTEHRDRMKHMLYNEPIIRQWPDAAPDRFQPEEATGLYRHLLENAEDASVTICSIGLMTVLAELLRSPGGIELVQRKVRRMVAMAEGIWPEGNPGFNWKMDPEAAEYVLSVWPSELLISPIGGNVLTGLDVAKLEERNPQRIAFDCFGEHRAGFRRPSWDQLTVLSAAGISDKGGYTGIVGRGKIRFDARSGRHRWEADANGPHACIGLLRDPQETAEWVEEFMTETWNNKTENNNGKGIKK